jgi:hypothetical protein
MTSRAPQYWQARVATSRTAHTTRRRLANISAAPSRPVVKIAMKVQPRGRSGTHEGGDQQQADDDDADDQEED